MNYRNSQAGIGYFLSWRQLKPATSSICSTSKFTKTHCHTVTNALCTRLCTSFCLGEGNSLPSDRWCKVLLQSGESLSKCDSIGEMAENVSGLWTPPGALSNLFWQSGAVMAICCSLPLCTQPEAHHPVVTTFLCDIASSRVVWLKKAHPRSLWSDRTRHQEHIQKTMVSISNCFKRNSQTR